MYHNANISNIKYGIAVLLYHKAIMQSGLEKDVNNATKAIDYCIDKLNNEIQIRSNNV